MSSPDGKFHCEFTSPACDEDHPCEKCCAKYVGHERSKGESYCEYCGKDMTEEMIAEAEARFDPYR